MLLKFGVTVIVLFICFLIPTSVAVSQMIPFAFWSVKSSTLNWDFTALSSLPSTLTFTRASTATYFNSSGVMQTASSDTPRFDYDPITHAPQGLLLEAAATNLNVCSENMNLSTCWHTEGATPMTTTLNVATAPDGTMTADRISSGGSASWIYPDLPTTIANVPYVFSIYLKSPSADGIISLAIQEAAGSYQTWAASDAYVTTSWKRFYVVGTKTNTNPMRFLMNLSNGHLPHVYAWGAQIELGSIPTSYIPVPSTTPITRAAETLTFNSMSWLNAGSGTLFAEYVNLRNENSATYRIFGLFNTNVSGTFSANSIEISDNNTTVTSNVTATSVQFSPGGSVNAINVINRQAITYKTNAFTSSINREAVTSDTSGSLPTINYGYIGSQPDGNMRNRYIRKIQYYNTNISNQQLQGL